MTTARALFFLGLRHLRGGSLRIIEPRTDRSFGRTAHAADELHANVWVHDERTYARVLRERSIGLGESYADGWWDTDDLTAVLRIARRTADRVLPLSDRAHRSVSPVLDLFASRHRADKVRDARNVRAHYDLGNDFFAAMLDETMMYSSAVFEQSDEPLASASTRKMLRLATLLNLTSDDHVLEIGSGWGGFAEYAAATYGCRVTTTTISRNQHDFVRARIACAGLNDLVDVRCVDYRDLDGTYDKVIAIEMIEAVNWRDYDTFFEKCRSLISDNGSVAMQAIVVPDESFDRAKHHEDFIKSVIFPGSCIPSARALTDAARRHDLTLRHQDDIGLHYAETLRRWRSNFADSAVGGLHLDERFRRLWEFYLAYCEAGFEEGSVGDVQLLYSAPRWRPTPFERSAVRAT